MGELEQAKDFLSKTYPNGIDNTNEELELFYNGERFSIINSTPNNFLYWRFNKRVFKSPIDMFYEIMEKY